LDSGDSKPLTFFDVVTDKNIFQKLYMFGFDFGEVLFPFGLHSPVKLLTDELFKKTTSNCRQKFEECFEIFLYLS
jgi:hypothetical protein